MAKRKPKTPRPPKRKPPVKNGAQSEHQDPTTGRFVPGNCANPNGRPKGSSGLKALIERADEMGIDVLALALKKAAKNNAILIALLNKFVPSAKSIEIRDETKGKRKVLFERVADDDNDDG